MDTNKDPILHILYQTLLQGQDHHGLLGSTAKKRKAMAPPSKLSVQRAEEVMERATPLLVAALSVAMIVLFPLCISNFHNLHTKGW